MTDPPVRADFLKAAAAKIKANLELLLGKPVGLEVGDPFAFAAPAEAPRVPAPGLALAVRASGAVDATLHCFVAQPLMLAMICLTQLKSDDATAERLKGAAALDDEERSGLKDVASFIRNGLVQAGCNVDHAANGRDGLFLATTENYDALVVDRMLPGIDGLTVIRTLRASANTTPVLILSALGEVDDRVKGLKAGGDDYLVKPFAFSELLARLEALARRAKTSADAPATVLKAADLEMDLLRREVRRAGKPIDLQPREFQLLEFLLRHVGQVVTRTMLLEGVWDYHFDPQTNVIDVHISRLRSKIDKGFERPLLHTVRGAGYRLDG